MKRALFIALMLSLCLCSCGQVQDVGENDSKTAQVQQPSEVESAVDAVEKDETDSEDIERNTTVSVAYPGDGHNIESENWDVDDESVKQQVFDWYEKFKNGEFEHVEKSDAKEMRIAGRPPMSVYFYDESNERLKVVASDSALADFCFDGEYYKFNDESDNFFKAAYDVKPSEA